MESPVERRADFLIVGLSRLAVPVVEGLCTEGKVVVLAKLDDRETRYADLLRGRAKVVYARELEPALIEWLSIDVRCLLAIADDDKENFKAAGICYEHAPTVPVVLRTLDSTLADELELATGGLNIRRAYDMSALAAPAFVAKALSDDASELEPSMTMRFGPEEIPLCKLKVTPASPLRRKTPDDVATKLKCMVIAVRRGPGSWKPATTDRGRLAEGDEVVVGGRLRDVFSAARRNSSTFPARSRIALKRRSSANRWRLLKYASFLWLFLLVVSVVLGTRLHLNPWEVPYRTIVTAAGEDTLTDEATVLQLLAFCSIVVWAILGGLLVSCLTDWGLERRLGKRPDDFYDHVVVCGLGDVGYRVAKLLDDIDIPTVVVSSPEGRFVHDLGWKVPIVNGNIRLADDLRRAGVDRAACMIAVTADDLANIEACVHAERMQRQPDEHAGRDRFRGKRGDSHAGRDGGIRTIARLFDEDLYRRFQFEKLFDVDDTCAAVDIAADAFVDAAIDDDAMRPFKVGDQDYCGLRYKVRAGLSAADIRQWEAMGVAVLALRKGPGQIIGPSAEPPESLDPGDTLILAGPEHVIRGLADVRRQGVAAAASTA